MPLLVAPSSQAFFSGFPECHGFLPPQDIYVPTVGKAVHVQKMPLSNQECPPGTPDYIKPLHPAWLPYDFCLFVLSLIHCLVSYVSVDTHFCIHTSSAVPGIQLVLKYWWMNEQVNQWMDAQSCVHTMRCAEDHKTVLGCKHGRGVQGGACLIQHFDQSLAHFTHSVNGAWVEWVSCVEALNHQGDSI